MYITYIIYSESCRKFYTGHTQNITNRLAEHNSGETKSIKACVPWKLMWQHEYSSRAEAMKMENIIKKRGAGRFLKDLE